MGLSQVIDVEPKPSWQESEVSCYAADGDLDPNGPRWFRGFLVYERIPGSSSATQNFCVDIVCDDILEHF